ncbi:UNVERIFIED_CONTAM: glycosyltransferase family 2 protein, partial [Prevotella sp. 15_C9]
RGKYIVSLDADSSLDRDALENVLLPFYLDSEVKAVGGCIEVRNYKETICSSLQAFEYLKRIQVGRTVTSALGIYHINTGAFGAF